jgi:hypothetical protein
VREQGGFKIRKSSDADIVSGARDVDRKYSVDVDVHEIDLSNKCRRFISAQNYKPCFRILESDLQLYSG